MGKSIKLVALVGDEEFVVGRCHPGQARILRKNGLAEWKKDHLVLLGAQPPLKGPSIAGEIEKVRALLPKDRLKSVADMYGQAEQPWQSYGIHQKALGIDDTSWIPEAAEIDPEGLLMTFEWSGSNRPPYGTQERMDPTEIRCETFADWVREAITRRDAGHDLLMADDPKRMMLGFVDDSTNEALYAPIRKMKMAQEADLEDLGVSLEELRTQEGRAALLGLVHEEWTPITEPDPDLESIWIQEVEETLGEEVRKAEMIGLADEWAKKQPWGVDEVRKAVAMASVTGETAPEGPFYYREHRINLFEQPPGGPRKGKWMVWLNLDETHAWQVDELSQGLEKAKATIDDFLEGADD
jgi:hypothetical protein